MGGTSFTLLAIQSTNTYNDGRDDDEVEQNSLLLVDEADNQSEVADINYFG